jgi:uncharacterized protein
LGFLGRFASNMYRSKPLQDELQSIVRDRQLGALDISNLLLTVTRNVSTDSPWLLTNNPRAKYNDPSRDDCNLRLPLWQIVRASSAAPSYFPPEQVTIGSKAFSFVDGGVTPYNNPAFAMFRIATEGAFHLEWPTGEDRMMLISVGTGSAAELMKLGLQQRWIWQYGPKIPSAMMYAMSIDQDIACRTVGRCVHGDSLDREMHDLKSCHPMPDPYQRGEPLPLTHDQRRAFLYARYNVELTSEGVSSLGMDGSKAAAMRELDAVAMIDDLHQAGQRAGKRDVKLATQFPGFLSPPHL